MGLISTTYLLLPPLPCAGKFDPRVIANFYDSIQPGPVVPPKPRKKGLGFSKCSLCTLFLFLGKTDELGHGERVVESEAVATIQWGIERRNSRKAKTKDVADLAARSLARSLACPPIPKALAWKPGDNSSYSKDACGPLTIRARRLKANRALVS